ncbi:MAG: efflux RND transporter periplasmic adaptor subunit [Acidobacteria bacterium]|nr:efflux RND transporter periplasmic adaptor subunit [Acidobacteriota bacterium]
MRGSQRLLLVGTLWLTASSAWGQAPPGGMGPAPVRYTEAREHAVRRAVQLPGTVGSRVVSIVASEVEGLVVDYPVREGDRVEEGQPLARLRTTALELRRDASRAQLREAEARLKLAERNLERARELFDAKVISQQQLDDAFYEFTAWQSRVEQLTAEIAQINHDIERGTIRAPFAGAIVRERTQVGEWLDKGDPVVEMMSLDAFEVRVEVPERYFADLRVGARAAVSFEALPGVEISGLISAVIPRADQQARTFPVKVRFSSPSRHIGMGMLAQVSFPAGEPYRATLVPKDAVVSQGRQKVVYLLNGDNTVSSVSVETGAGVGGWVEVRGALRAGQKVITRGNERLRPGQTVAGQPLEYELP